MYEISYMCSHTSKAKTYYNFSQFWLIELGHMERAVHSKKILLNLLDHLWARIGHKRRKNTHKLLKQAVSDIFLALFRYLINLFFSIFADFGLFFYLIR
jgi:hypothetical protein